MTEHPTTVRMDDGVFEITQKTSETRVRRLPVMGDEGAIAGIITLDDLLVLFTDEMNGLATVVEAESTPYRFSSTPLRSLSPRFTRSTHTRPL